MLKRCTIIAIIFMIPLVSMGQKTSQFENPTRLYNQAVDLYDNNVYNSSIEKFDEFIAANPNDIHITDAQFYIAVSKLKLEHENALVQALELLKKHPENRKSNELNLAIANAYLLKSKFKQAARHLKNVDLNSLPPGAKDEFTFNKAYALFKSKKYDEST